MTSTSNIAIGIDLGTTNSCVAIYQHGKIKVIQNSEGNRTTPSEVAFKKSERLVGDMAKKQNPMNPKNTIFDAKRMIGRRFDDRELQSDIKNFPFRVVSRDSQPVIQVNENGREEEYTPEQISSMVLDKMKKTAELHLGAKVKDAVITVPAYFNDGQRQATKDAAILAGLNVLRIINEPTAAALAYGFEKHIEKKETVLIFDLGGGTFDVSVVEIIPGGVFEVKSTTGDTHFGGSDFDQRLMEHFAEEFKKEHQIDVFKNPKSMRKLRNACEVAKKSLSANKKDAVVVDSLYDGIDVEYDITREQFERICDDLFMKIVDPVNRALEDANLRKSQIDEVVLVGGSTRIPKIQEILRNMFNGKELNNSISPDEAVAYGAAAHAATLSGVRFGPAGHIILRDVTPLSLGIQTEGKLMTNIIPRNTQTPHRACQPFTTTKDNQNFLRFQVYEGERTAAEQNHKLGEFELTGVTPKKRGEVLIEVSFEINEDGILTVTAVEKSTGNTRSMVVKKGRLDPKDVENMVKAADSAKKEDRFYEERASARIRLTNYLHEMKDIVEKKANILLVKDAETLRTACHLESKWLVANENASSATVERRFDDFARTCEPILEKLTILEPFMNNLKIN